MNASAATLPLRWFRPGNPFVAVAVTLVIALVLASPAPANGEVAKPAASFIESIGVNTHTYYTDSVYYSRFGTIEQRLRELGIHHIRENLETDRADQVQRLNQLAGDDIRSTLILGSPADPPGTLDELVSIVGSELPGSVDAVEGPNEYDLRGKPDWMPELASYQARLYAAMKSNSSTSSLPVIGPSLGNPRSQASDISGSLDYGNIHSYPNGEAPEGNVSRMLTMAAAMSGSHPVIATETGYHTALNYQGSHQPVSEAAQAVYMPRLYLDYFAHGIARTFAYELADREPDPSGSEAEYNFGLLRNDLSPKPAFTAVQNLTSILSDPGPSFIPGSLDYSVQGNQADLHQVLLQKRDGSYYLALWRASSVWDVAQRTPIAAADEPVELELPARTERVDRYMPNLSGAPLNSPKLRPGQPLQISVGPEVVILRVQLGTAAVGRIHVWAPRHTVRAGARIAIRGRLPGPAASQTLRVRVQRWHHGWQTVGHTRTTKNGVFRKKIRVPAHSSLRTPRLRVVAPLAKPSRPVRLHIRRH